MKKGRLIEQLEEVGVIGEILSIGAKHSNVILTTQGESTLKIFGVKKKVILTTYSPLLYTQNMSEPEERPYAGIDEQKQEELHEGEETTVEEKREGVEAIRTTEEKVAKEKAPELEEEKVKVNVKQTRKKKMELLIRWEKKIENYVAMLHFACAWITFRVGLFT
jgi:hypothetical protein